jgi:hypothetical protein
VCESTAARNLHHYTIRSSRCLINYCTSSINNCLIVYLIIYIFTILFQLGSKKDVIGLSPNSLDQGAAPNNYINGTLRLNKVIAIRFNIIRVRLILAGGASSFLSSRLEVCMHLSFLTFKLHPADIMQSDFITLRICIEEYKL